MWLENNWLFQAFNDLSATRQNNGFSPCPISTTNAFTWAQMNHETEELEFYWLVIRTLDSLWLKDWAAKQKRK